MVRCRAVLETMNATRALRYVAADRATRLTRRIGHVIQTVGQHRSRDMQVHDTWLHHRQTIFNVDAQYLAHPGELDHHSRIERERAARESGSGPARCERNLEAREFAHDRGGLFSRRREDNSARAMFVLRQAVAFVD